MARITKTLRTILPKISAAAALRFTIEAATHALRFTLRFILLPLLPLTESVGQIVQSGGLGEAGSSSNMFIRDFKRNGGAPAFLTEGVVDQHTFRTDKLKIYQAASARTMTDRAGPGRQSPCRDEPAVFVNRSGVLEEMF